jgi:hypothetical protein
MPRSRRSSSAGPSLADRLADARHRSFVGRKEELSAFRSACRGGELPFAVLYLVGPGGVGKTSLLHEYLRVARGAGGKVAYLDGHGVTPAPDEFLRALGQALGGETGSPREALARAKRSFVLIDTFERLAALDGWFSQTFLPQLPERCLVVIAGRTAPSLGLSSQLGGLLRVISLRNLPPEESRRYLRARGVPEARHQVALEFTHGHPLALSLVAEAAALGQGLVASTPEAQPHVVGTLLDHFVQGVPSAAHRLALEATAHARTMTEDLLAAALALDDAHELFGWLRGLSFIEQGPRGVFPHDLVRDLIDADLRWRNPGSYRLLHGRVRGFIVDRLQTSQGLEQQQVFFDLLYLHRHNPVLKPFYDWGSLGSLRAEPAAPEDHASILEMVRQHEGEAARRIAEHWLRRQPEAFVVFRGGQPGPAGFVALLCLAEPDPEDVALDPAIRGAWDFVHRHGDLRPGERILHGRFAMARDTYHDLSPVIDMISATCTMGWLSTPRLAWAFALFSDPDRWEPMFRYIRLARCPEADFRAGRRLIGAFAHDFRAEPPVLWLEALGQQELTTEAPPPAASAAPPPVVVLSRPAFEEAVRRALRDYTRAEALDRNPLLRSRLVLGLAPARTGAEALRALIGQAADALKARPRDEKFHQALRLTYLEPAPTQEDAAERLDLPFGTYRYQLGIAIERVTEWLWQRELADIRTE